MNQSLFQFKDPVLTDLEFKVNQNFNADEKDEIEFKNDFKVMVARENSNPRAVVTLKVMINNDSNNAPFYCSATMSAFFKWEETIDENLVELLLNQNAPSLLLSYLRPLISNTVAASKYPPYNIPFMNFTQEKE